MLINEPITAVIVLPLLAVVTVCAVTDVLDNRIPNIVLLPALVLAVICNTFLAGVGGFVDCLQGLFVGLAFLFPFYVTGGTSAGDVKLLGVVGALLGPKGALAAGLATLIFGAALGLLFVAWRMIKPVLMMYAERIVRSEGLTQPVLTQSSMPEISGSTYFPYAPAIMCGTYYSLWHLGYFSQFSG